MSLFGLGLGATAFILGGLLFLVALVVVLSGVRFIPNNRIGIVEKRWSGRGSLKSGFIALAGEAGYQPNVLRGGIHLLTPFQFGVHTAPLVTITQGKIGYVFARDGLQLDPTQTLASNVASNTANNAVVTPAVREKMTGTSNAMTTSDVAPNDFQDVAGFLRSGGQRGPQRQILREGTYAINLAQFVVITEERVYFLPLNRDEEEIINQMATIIGERGGFRPVIIKDSDDLVGIVTVHDGPSLSDGEIIAKIVGDDAAQPDTYHNNFQDPERFLQAGGRRGRQLQALAEGTYYINRLFATVEYIQKTTIEVGTVGVVVSYAGAAGADLSGTDYKHGELVTRGNRGVWSEPLMPGKYAFNTYAGKVVSVPTTNIILKWLRDEIGGHKLDENLREISLITKDAFEPSLPLSVVVHIDYRKAPLVIQRFGDVKKLVEQTLDPMVSAYFKNIGQTRTLIQLIQERSDIQAQSSLEMREKFNHYNLELEEVLIGTPASSEGDDRIEIILNQLRSRQVADEQIETYARQEKAATKERELREAESRARQQQSITESELSITVQTNQGKAEYQRSLQQAAQIQAMAEAEGRRVRILAEAEADKVRAMGEAEADKAAKVGVAQAIAIEEQVRAYGGPQFQLTQQVMNRFAEAVEHAGVDVVPRIVIGGGSGDGKGGGMSGGLIDGLMAMLLSDKMGDVIGKANDTPRDAATEDLRNRVRAGLNAPLADQNGKSSP
ncbi:MAG TPA: SPFH domain-containing protein [Abditibacteriaceae bacterium]